MQTPVEQPGFNGEEAIYQFMRAISLLEMRKQARNEGITEIPPRVKAGPVFGHWMAVILIAGDGLRVTFKTFFDRYTVRTMVAARMGIAANALNETLPSDFMKEFCNVFAGAVKRVFHEQGISVGISLPLVTRGSDELFCFSQEHQEIRKFIWSHNLPTGSLTYKAEIDLVQSNLRPLITWHPSQLVTQRAQDDLEFL